MTVATFVNNFLQEWTCDLDGAPRALCTINCHLPDRYKELRIGLIWIASWHEIM